MIKDKVEYQECLNRLRQDEEFIRAQKKYLSTIKLSRKEIKRVMERTYCFHEQLKEEVQ